MIRFLVAFSAVLVMLSSVPALAESAMGDGRYSFSDFDKYADGAKEWDVTLGGGIWVRPRFEGAKRYRTRLMPMVDVRWRERTFFNPWRGLGHDAIKTDNLTAGPFISYDFGRDQDADRHLRGLGDVDGGVDFGAFVTYTTRDFSVDFSAKQNVFGHKGFQVKTALMYRTYTGQRTFINVGPTLTYASNNYMDSFFSVNQRQSDRSGLRRFNADSGFKNIGMTLSARHMLTDQWFLLGIASHDWLLGDAHRSPVSQKRGVTSVSLGAGYRF